MANFKQMLNSKYGRHVVAVILGFGLATFFRKSCGDSACMEFKAPEMEKIDRPYRYNGACYKFTPYASVCDDSRKTVPFA